MKLSSRHKTFLGILLIFLAVRLSVFGICGMSFDFTKYPHESWLSIWDRWDSEHYKYIAQNLYQIAGRSAEAHHFVSRFPPLYPLLVRLTADLCALPLFVAGVCVSLCCLLIASYLIYQLVSAKSGSSASGWRAVLLLNLFPSAYFSQTAYSDGLFVLLVVGLFVTLEARPSLAWSWVLAGLAILTRVAGGILCLPVAWVLLRKVQRKEARSADFFGGFAPIAALGIYLQINKSYFGDYFAFLKDYSTNVHSVHAGFSPFAETFFALWSMLNEFPQRYADKFFMMTQGWGAMLMLLMAVVMLASARKLAGAYQVFGWGYLVFIGSLRWAISTPRYLWAQVPVIIALACLRSMVAFWLIAGLMFGLQIYLAVEFTTGKFAY